MSYFKNGIGCSTGETDENSCCLHYRDISIFKAQGSLRDNLENYYWEETPQNKTISCSGKQFISFSKWYSIADFVLSQLSSIASQPTLGVELLSLAFDSTSTEPPSAGPRKELISVNITDPSTTSENVSLSLMLVGVFYLTSWFIQSFTLHLTS